MDTMNAGPITAMAGGLLADSILVHNFLAWLFYGLAFAAAGMGVARFVWNQDQRRLRELELETDKLRLERNDLERKLKSGLDE
jgi:hypothetical protein